MIVVMCIDDEGGGALLPPPCIDCRGGRNHHMLNSTLQINLLLIEAVQFVKFPALRMEESVIAHFRGQKVQILYPG